MRRAESLSEYLRSHPRLCAAMIAYTGPDLTPHGATFFLRDAHERLKYDPGARAMPVPTRERALVAQAYQGRHALHADYRQALALVRRASSPVAEPAPALDRVVVRSAPSLPNLIITTEGFLNLEQVAEYRLQYVDLRRTDAIWGVDVLLSNGTSHLIQRNDPGFDQLIDFFEDQGYTISTGDRR